MRHSFETFRSFLASKNIGLTFAELGDGLAAVSPNDSGRGYTISRSREGWSSEIVDNSGKRQEIFHGANRDEAVLACLTDEAMKNGIPELAFKHIATGISMKSADLLKAGSTYIADNDSRITVRDPITPGHRSQKVFDCMDAQGNELGTFTDLKLATGYVAVMKEAARAPLHSPRAVETTTKSFQDAISLTLRITSKPLLTETASGFAQLTLIGVDIATGKERPIPIRGDRAKALAMVLSTRAISENTPVDIRLEGKLKPLRTLEAGSGKAKTVLSFEATAANVLPSRQRRDLGMEMQVA